MQLDEPPRAVLPDGDARHPQRDGRGREDDGHLVGEPAHLARGPSRRRARLEGDSAVLGQAVVQPPPGVRVTGEPLVRAVADDRGRLGARRTGPPRRRRHPPSCPPATPRPAAQLPGTCPCALLSRDTPSPPLPSLPAGGFAVSGTRSMLPWTEACGSSGVRLGGGDAAACRCRCRCAVRVRAGRGSPRPSRLPLRHGRPAPPPGAGPGRCGADPVRTGTMSHRPGRGRARYVTPGTHGTCEAPGTAPRRGSPQKSRTHGASTRWDRADDIDPVGTGPVTWRPERMGPARLPVPPRRGSPEESHTRAPSCRCRSRRRRWRVRWTGRTGRMRPMATNSRNGSSNVSTGFLPA